MESPPTGRGGGGGVLSLGLLVEVPSRLWLMDVLSLNGDPTVIGPGGPKLVRLGDTALVFSFIAVIATDEDSTNLTFLLPPTR